MSLDTVKSRALNFRGCINHVTIPVFSPFLSPCLLTPAMAQFSPLGTTAMARPAVLGGIPSKSIDVPICTVLVACYLGLGATHVAIFRHNRALGRTFRPSLFCAAFCAARVVTFTVRLAWACSPLRVSLAITANVLIAAGVVILVSLVTPLHPHPSEGCRIPLTVLARVKWFMNRVFATRLFGEYHPHAYSSTPFRLVARRLPYALVLCCIPIGKFGCLSLGVLANYESVIVAVVQEVKTSGAHTLHVDSIILKIVLCFFLAFNFSPFLALLVTCLAPGRKNAAAVRELQQRLGTGKTIKKVAVIVITTSLLLWELVRHLPHLSSRRPSNAKQATRAVTVFQRYPASHAPW